MKLNTRSQKSIHGTLGVWRHCNHATSCLGANYKWQRVKLNAQGLNIITKNLTQGIIMNLTNPKVSLFFLAFLPQFTDPEQGGLALQIMALGGIFMVATLLVFGAIAFLAGSLGQWINRSEKGQRILNRIAAFVFAGLAITLIVT